MSTKLIFSTQDEQELQQSKEFFCYSHSSAKGDYYCLTCFQIICKHCFTTDHTTHKANTLLDTVSDFMVQIKQLSKNITSDNKQIEDSIKEQKDYRQIALKQEEDYLKQLSQIKEITSKTIIGKNESQYAEFLKIYNSLDETIETISNKLTNKKFKQQEIYNQLISLRELIQNLSSFSFEICSYFSKNKNILNIAKDMLDPKSDIELLEKLLSSIDRLKTFEERIRNNSEDYCLSNNLVVDVVKHTLDYSNSNKTYSLRRFCEYAHNISDISEVIKNRKLSFNNDGKNASNSGNITYFKTSSVTFKVKNKNLLFKGIGLCGLISGNNNSKDSSLKVRLSFIEDSSSVLTIDSFNKKLSNTSNSLNNNDLSKNLTDSIKFSNKETEINPSTILSAFTNKEILNKESNSKKIVYSKEVEISYINNTNDPVIKFNLDDVIYLKQNNYYSILIQNLSKDYYTNMYLGFTNNELNNNNNSNTETNNKQIQEIECLNTDSEFVFFKNKDFSTDFDELSCGIISDLWFQECE